MAVAADQGSWQVSQGVLDGQVIFTRFNTALVSVADRADYAFQIGVAVPLLDPAIAGLPQGQGGMHNACRPYCMAADKQASRTLRDRAALAGTVRDCSHP